MKSQENYKAAATALNIKMYYGVLAKAEKRENEYAIAMFLYTNGHKSYISHITPAILANMDDTDKIMLVMTANGEKKYKTFTKDALCNNAFQVVRDKFLENRVHTYKRALATHTTHIYDMLHNSCMKLKSEDDYYENLAKEHEMQTEYAAMCQYGNCNDAAWQEGM